MKSIFLLLIISACADLTETGSKVQFVEVDGAAWQIQETADKMVAKHDCRFVGYVDAKTSVFPGSYSSHENEIHSALRNRAAKIGANVVVANFYKKPAQGVGLECPSEYLNQ
jgi:hypothetical protein